MKKFSFSEAHKKQVILGSEGKFKERYGQVECIPLMMFQSKFDANTPQQGGWEVCGGAP